MALVDVAVVEWDGVELNTLESLDVEDNDNSESVYTMRRNRLPLGVKRGNREVSIELECKKLDPPEVDWLAVKAAAALHLLVYEENEGGTRYVAEGCRVTAVSKSFTQDGDAADRVTIIVTGRHEPEG